MPFSETFLALRKMLSNNHLTDTGFPFTHCPIGSSLLINLQPFLDRFIIRCINCSIILSCENSTNFHCVNVSRTLLTHTFTSTCKFPPPHLETTNYTLQRTHNLHYLNIYLQIRPERSPLSSYHITIFAALFLCSKIAHTFLSFLLSVVVVHSIQDWAPFWLQTNFNLQITPSQPSQSSWFFSPASLKQTKLFREKILALFNKTTKFGWSLYGTRTEFGSGGIDKNDHQE